MSGPRPLPSVLIFKLEAVIEHFHRDASDVSPTQVLRERALHGVHSPPCRTEGNR